MKNVLRMLIVTIGIVACSTSEDSQKVLLANAEFKKSISNTKIIELFTNDQDTRLSILKKQNMSLEDRVSYFELQTLKNYLNNIESKAKEHNINISGINFVLAADKNLKRTVFLVPMFYDEDSKFNTSFIIENERIIHLDVLDENLNRNIISNNKSNTFILSTSGFLPYNISADWFNNYETHYIKPIKKIIKKEFYTKTAWYSLEKSKIILHI